MVTSDTCLPARATSRMTVDAVEKVIKEKAEADGEEYLPSLVRMDCHHHLRNVWLGALNKHLSKYLTKLLQEDLNAIDFRYRVTTMFDAVLRAVDKEFSLPANYPKGHGDMFKIWMELHHPGAMLLPVERSTGSRHDLIVEGAAAVYWNRRYVLKDVWEYPFFDYANSVEGITSSFLTKCSKPTTIIFYRRICLQS